MNDKPPLPFELSTIVEQLFSQRFLTGYHLLKSIRGDIVAREQLHCQISAVIDEQIRVHRNRLVAFEGWLKTDYSLWLHPRRNQLERIISDWQQVRLSHLTGAWEQIQRLRNEERDAERALMDAQRSKHLLDMFAGYGYDQSL